MVEGGPRGGRGGAGIGPRVKVGCNESRGRQNRQLRRASRGLLTIVMLCTIIDILSKLVSRYG